MMDVRERVEALKPEISELVKTLHANPELGMEERFAVKLQAELLTNHGFKVETGIAGLETSYIASYKGEKDGPRIAFLAEYDALPDLGHACGHNMIAGIACCGGIALKDAVDQYGGEVLVIGAPGEETDGGKVYLADAGYYDNLDAAMLAHARHQYAQSGSMYAIEALQFEYFGKEAHASAAPETGVNALDSVIQLFVSINAMREHLRDTVRIHGIINNGGSAPNTVPGYASARFYVRDRSTKYLREVVKKVKLCAEAAAVATGATLKITNFENGYDGLMTNRTLSQRVTDKLYELGIKVDIQPNHSKGSTDMGAVSQKCPAIHAWFDITGDESVMDHTPEFALCTVSEYGLKHMFLQAEAMVMTGEDLLRDPEFLASVKEEHQKNLDAE